MGRGSQTIIGSSYLSGLKQYGSDGHAIFNPSTDWTIDTGYDNGATTAPGNANKDTEIQFVLNNRSTFKNQHGTSLNWKLPLGLISSGSSGSLKSPIYVVVWDNGDGSANNGGGTYTATNGSSYLTNTIRIDNGTIEDSFTDLFTHELAERISDGTGQGIGMNAPTNITGEYQNAQISDNEPDGGNYTYRLNGSVLVQAYWSIVDQAFIVPDGKQQNIVLDPIWEGISPTSFSFTGQFVSLRQGNLYELSPAGRTSTLIDTQVSAYATDSLGDIFDLGTSRGVKVYLGSGTNWTPLTGANTRVSALVSAKGRVYMLAANNGGVNQVWKYSGSGTNWTPVTGTNTVVSGAGIGPARLPRAYPRVGRWRVHARQQGRRPPGLPGLAVQRLRH